MDLPVQAIAEYQEAVNFRFALWVEFMCGRLEARHVPRWPEHPVFPPESIPPEPLAVWICRPRALPVGLLAPSTYDLRYRFAEFEGLRFLPFTGRSTEGRNASRHGRLNWPATFAARDAWEKETRGAQAALQAELARIQEEALKTAFSRIPHVTMVHGSTEHHLFQHGYDKSFGVAICHDGGALYLPPWTREPRTLKDAIKSLPQSNKTAIQQISAEAQALFPGFPL